MLALKASAAVPDSALIQLAGRLRCHLSGVLNIDKYRHSLEFGEDRRGSIQDIEIVFFGMTVLPPHS